MVQQHFILQNVYGEDDETTTKKNARGKIFIKKKTEIDLLTTSFLMVGCVCSLIVDGKISGVLTYRLTPKMVMLLLMTILKEINYFDFLYIKIFSVPIYTPHFFDTLYFSLFS